MKQKKNKNKKNNSSPPPSLSPVSHFTDDLIKKKKKRKESILIVSIRRALGSVVATEQKISSLSHPSPPNPQKKEKEWVREWRWEDPASSLFIPPTPHPSSSSLSLPHFYHTML
eukprot:Sspe_Gene.73212::Locus_44033_Transcript_1_6_Confidence_0.286_Length_852::g.73212::m.73212